MDSLTPLVQPLSIDEAFLDLSGTEKAHKAPPALTLARLAKRIEEDIGVTISIGLSHNKFLAKIASEIDKPRGFAVIGKAETVSYLADKPITVIFGVGKVMAETLRKDGLITIGQLQQRSPEDLMRRYGEMGARLAKLARGEDYRRVSSTRETKSVSTETTFFTDLSDFDSLSTALLSLSERLSERLKKQGLVGDTITVKLKTAGFKSRTRAQHIMLPTQHDALRNRHAIAGARSGRHRLSPARDRCYRSRSGRRQRSDRSDRAGRRAQGGGGARHGQGSRPVWA
jgi:DNA polymerase-4